MLERVPTCIESGGRLLRASKRGITTKRRLHCAFWHHGAGDLNNPASWASLATSIPLARCPSEEADTTTSNQTQSTSTFMDFLYPPPTKALMQRISNSGWERWKANTPRARNTLRARLYSSISKDMDETSDPPPTFDEGPPSEPSLRENLERYHRSDPLGALKYILVSDLQKDYDVAWQIYRQLEKMGFPDSLKAGLIDYLSTSTRPEDNSRVLDLFESLSPEHGQSIAYRAAIVAHLKLKTIGKAMEIHQEAVKHADSAVFGTDILLARLCYDRQWDLAFQTFEAYETRASKETFPEPVNVFALAGQLPNHLARFYQFFKHLRVYASKFQKEGKTSVYKACLRGFTEAILPHITTRISRHDHVWKHVFVRIQKAGISKLSYYEETITKLLNWGIYKKRLSYNALPWTLYDYCISEAKKTPNNPDFTPSKEFLQLLFSTFHRYHQRMDIHVKRSDDDTILISPPGITFQRLVEDWKHFHGPLPREMLRTLMRVYAERGRVGQVFEYFKELSNLESAIEVGDLVPLIQVYARQANPSAAQKQFDGVKNEFGLVPNIYCWSILIDAYARADDLPGALRCLNTLMATGLKVSAESFGPILNLMAIRGDVAGVYGLLDDATRSGIDTNTVKLRVSAVTAHLNDGNLPAAEEELMEFMNKLPPGQIRRTITPIWNPILVHHALNGNFVSMAHIYQKMQEYRIPFDTWTYAAVIRGMCVVHETDRAWKIIRLIMPQKYVRPLAFHYCLVMRGYITQGQPERSLEVYRWMQTNGVSETYTSRQLHIEARLALEGRARANKPIRLTPLGSKRGYMDQDGKPLWTPPRKGISDPLHEYQVDQSMDPEQRLDLLIEDIKTLMGLVNEAEYSAKEPRAFGVTKMNQSLPETFFQGLIMSYGMERSFDLAVDLFGKLLSKDDPTEQPHFEASVRLLQVLMRAYIALEDHDSVDKCWKMMRDNAQKFVRKSEDMVLPLPETYNNSSETPSDGPLYLQTGPEGSERLMSLIQSIHLTPNAKRRRLLSLATTNYMKYLMDQQFYDNVIEEFIELGIMGYFHNNGAWNFLAEALVRSNRIFDAFVMFEKYLMPSFTSWYMRINTKKQGGHLYTYMKTSAAHRRRPIGPQPHYRTLVIMASALMHVRQSEGTHPTGGMNTEVTGRLIRDIAPQTVEALDEMPLVKGDDLQSQFLDIK